AGIGLWPSWGRPVYEKYLRPTVDDYLLDVPVLGPVLGKSAYARMLHAMATLLQAGLGIGPPMAVVGSLSQNLSLERKFKVFVAEVTEGAGLGDAARSVFPPMVCQMFRVGEEQGRLDSLLERAALIYEEDVESALITLTALLEPLMLIFMGVVVGVVVVATSLPTLQLMQNL
ncbi:MAG: type II secretion system F family protein, partial [Candidatus Eremiobacterota bacterium]